MDGLEKLLDTVTGEPGWIYRIYHAEDCTEQASVDFETGSPAGEAFLMNVDFDEADPLRSLAENLQAYSDHFDPDEHAETWVEYRGKNGAPESIRTLPEDAGAIQEEIRTLSAAVTEAAEDALCGMAAG